MVDNKPRNVTEYLKQLPPDKRKVISTIRKTILKHLPKGYKESISWHMIAYCIPLSQYSDTYNKQPLGYLAVAVQKNYFALYMMGVYMDKAQETALKDGFKKAGKRLNIGGCCLDGCRESHCQHSTEEIDRFVRKKPEALTWLSATCLRAAGCFS
jgi:hypothetical protein